MILARVISKRSSNESYIIYCYSKGVKAYLNLTSSYHLKLPNHLR